MADAKLSVEVGAKIDELQSKMAAAKASVKSFTGYTDAELLKTSQNYQNFGGVNERLAEKVAATAKAQRLAAEAQKAANIETVAGTSAITGLDQAATKGLSALRNIAYVLPGIGVAGIFTLAFEAITPLIQQVDLFNTKLSVTAQLAKDNTEAQLDLFKVRQKGEENAKKELVTTDSLYRATQNQALSLTERNKAVDALQKKYPEYLGNLTNEAILAGQGAKNYELLKGAIIAKSLAQAQEEDIAKRAVENDKLKFNNSVRQNAILRNQADIQKFINEDKRVGSEQVIALDERIINAQKNINLELKGQADNGNIIRRNNTFIALSAAEIDSNVQKLGVNILGVAEGTQKITKDTGKFNEELEKSYYLAERIDSLLNVLKPVKLRGEGDVFGRNVDIGISALGDKFQHLGEIVKQTFKPTGEIILTPFQNLLGEVLPKLQTGFETFFNDILEHGKFSFAALGQAILKTFESIIGSEVTRTLINIVANASGIQGTTKGGGGGVAGIATGAAASAIPLLAGGTAASGGLLLPIVAGIAGIALISSLFKKHKQPDPVYTSNNPISSGGSGGGNQVLTVILKASGRDLFQTLNLEGYYLSRVQQRGG